MQMSGSCRRSERGARRMLSAAGFSLLELLVVLALISMITAMVAPSLQRTYNAIAGSGERAEVRRQLERLPLLARAAGEPIELPAGASAVLAGRIDLPEGWSARPLDPVRVEASGVCHRARVQLQGRGTTEEVVLSSPDCRVRDVQ